MEVDISAMLKMAKARAMIMARAMLMARARIRIQGQWQVEATHPLDQPLSSLVFSPLPSSCLTIDIINIANKLCNVQYPCPLS